MSRFVRWLSIAALSLALAPALAHAQDRAAQLEQRAHALARDRGAEAAHDALDHATRALAAAGHAPDEAARARALDIAEAALTLADRLAARARARLALADAQSQLQAARVRAAAAREALDHALAERARLAIQPPPAPTPPPAEGHE